MLHARHLILFSWSTTVACLLLIFNSGTVTASLLIFPTFGQESLSVGWSSLPKRTSKLLFAMRCKCYEAILHLFLGS